MNDHVNERLARLEQEVAELRRRLDERLDVTPIITEEPPGKADLITPAAEADEVNEAASRDLASQPAPDPTSDRHEPSPTDAGVQTDRRHRPPASLTNDAWIGKVGIGLVIIGAVFLFKLAVDSGWITPVTRVGIGAILGLGLIVVGLRLRPEQALLRQLLPGGGIAILHLTLFAAVVLYELIPPPIAWLGLLAVSVFGFWNARHVAQPPLAWVAFIGGVQGIFTLGIGQGMPTVAYAYINALVGLALYVGATARWSLLPWGVFVLGGGAVAFIPADDNVGSTIRLLAMVLPTIVSLLTIWRAPVSRDTAYRDMERIGLGVANFVMPFAWVSWLARVLNWNINTMSIALIAAAVIVAICGWWLIRGLTRTESGAADVRIIPDTFAIPVSALFLVAASAIFQEEAELFAFLIIAFAMGLVAFRNNWPGLKFVGVLTGLIATFMVYEYLLFTGYATAPFANIACLVIAVAIAAPALLALQRRHTREAIGYWAVAYISLLIFVLHQLGGTAGGQALVSLIWSAFGVALYVIGLKGREAGPGVLRAGSTTLALVVGKLFVVDLAGLSTVVRTVIFLVIGGLFLGVSYVSGKLKQGPK